MNTKNLKGKLSSLFVFINLTSLTAYAEPTQDNPNLLLLPQGEANLTSSKNVKQKPEITLKLDSSPIDIHDPFAIAIENKLDKRIENSLKEPGLKVNITIWFD